MVDLWFSGDVVPRVKVDAVCVPLPGDVVFCGDVLRVTLRRWRFYDGQLPDCVLVLEDLP